MDVDDRDYMNDIFSFSYIILKEKCFFTLKEDKIHRNKNLFKNKWRSINQNEEKYK